MIDNRPTMKTGYPMTDYHQPTKRFCQTLELVDDKDSIEKYKSLHSAQNHWKEIRDGIRAVGILEMEIYILGTHLFMIVEVPVDFDWDEAMEKLASLPRQKEWENTVEVFQACRPGSTSFQKWQMMERIFYLYE